MKKFVTQRKVTRQDIADIRRQIKALPKKIDCPVLHVQIGISSGCMKETVAYAALLKKKLKKANILASSQPLLYFWGFENVPGKDYEVMKEQPYDSPYIRVYDLSAAP